MATVILGEETLYVVPVTRKGGNVHQALGRKRPGRQGGYDWVISPRPEEEFRKELTAMYYSQWRERTESEQDHIEAWSASRADDYYTSQM